MIVPLFNSSAVSGVLASPFGIGASVAIGAVDFGIGDCTGCIRTGKPDGLEVGDAMMRVPGATVGFGTTNVGRGNVAGAAEGMGNVGCGIVSWAARSDAKDESIAGGNGLPCPSVKT